MADRALGSILLVLVAIVALTGFLSHVAYMPDLGCNAIVPKDRDFPLEPSTGRPRPSWLYALNQGLHTNVGLVVIPFLLAKLWSVIPRLFAWPPVTSPAQAIERLSIALLVASASSSSPRASPTRSTGTRSSSTSWSRTTTARSSS